MTAGSTLDRCPRCGAGRSTADPQRCTQCGYRYRSVPTVVARRDRLARWDPWLGIGVPISLGTILAALGVSGDDVALAGIGVAVAVVGAPLGWLIGRRSQARRA
jgi:ribosomal protein L37E